MEKSAHDLRIEKIAEMLTSDNISIDEQNQNKLKKYHNFAKASYGLDDIHAAELVNEAFLYLNLKSGVDIDPLTKGDQFGAGFS